MSNASKQKALPAVALQRLVKRRTIAECAEEVMREQGMTTIWYGDLAQLHEIANRAGVKCKISHPLNTINAVLCGIGRGKQFEAGRIKHLRWCRAYSLRGPLNS